MTGHLKKHGAITKNRRAHTKSCAKHEGHLITHINYIDVYLQSIFWGKGSTVSAWPVVTNHTSFLLV